MTALVDSLRGNVWMIRNYGWRRWWHGQKKKHGRAVSTP